MRILLISPQTPDTFWSFKHVLRFVSKRAAFPPLGLLTVAAMLPRAWDLRLVDLNVERLQEADLRWAELAIFRRAYRLVRGRGLPVKLLISSMCIGPCTADGSRASWHVEKTAGADVVYACPPPFIEALMAIEDDLGPFRPDAVEEEVPRGTLAKLERLPYFTEACEPDGLTPEQFNRHAALIATAAEFARATRLTVDFVAQQFEALRAG